MLHYKSFLTEEMVRDVMKNHAAVYLPRTTTMMLLSNEEYVDFMMEQYHYTKEQILNDMQALHPQSREKQISINYTLLPDLKRGYMGESSYQIIKQIELLYKRNYIHQKEEPKKIQEDLMYIPESNSGIDKVIDVILVEKTEEAKPVDVIAPIELDMDIDDETERKVMRTASRQLNSILDLKITTDRILQLQECIRKEKLKITEVKNVNKLAFTAENQWVKLIFCENNVGICVK